MLATMDGLLQILTLIAFLAGGAVLVVLKLAPPSRVVDHLIRFVLWGLLFAMGFRIGNDSGVAAQLSSIGLLAGATAVLSVAGTIVAIMIAALFIPDFRAPSKAAHGGNGKHGGAGREGAKHDKASGLDLAHLKAPAILLSIVAAGFALGVILPETALNLSGITGWILNILLFFIGMQFAQAGISLKEAFLKPATLVVPIATAAGTLVASLLLIPLFNLSAGKALALSGGFGWYSLSGVLITDMGDPALGSTAFLANMFRETIALLTIPFLARTRIPYLAVGVGGATSMDVTLPLIEQSAGPWIVPASFVSGALLSISVPFLVPFFFGLG